MKTNTTIAKLVQDLKPVEKVTLGLKEYLSTAFAAGVSIALGVLVLEPRTNIFSVLKGLIFILESVSLFLAAWFATIVSYKLSIPGKLPKFYAWSAVVLIAVWIVLILFSARSTSHLDMGSDLTCLRDILLIGSLPTLVTVYLARKGIQTRRSMTGIFIILAGSAYGAFASQIVCADENPLHLLALHAFAVIGLALTGLIFGRLFFRKL